MSHSTGAGPGPGRLTGIDWATLLGLLALAALLRIPNLATRGTWDGDQGHDMLVLRAFVRDGVVPLLGPPTSIGDVHHGAWYYYLLSPAAFLTGGDSPLAVVSLIALAGIAAVGVVWWLGRSIGGSIPTFSSDPGTPTAGGPPFRALDPGRIAGLVAALALAVSAAAVDESTFIWNPNLIALSSAVALAGAWRGWRGDSPWWWVVAAIGTAVTMQCHVLGVALLPLVAVPFVLDWRRRGSLGSVPLAVLGVFVLAYLPLAINELTTGFSETRAAVDYLTGEREAGAAALPVRFLIVGLRVVSWPLVGLITDAFVPAIIATSAVVAIIAWRWSPTPTDPSPADVYQLHQDASPGDESRAIRWLGLGLLWSTAFLAVAAPSLASVVAGLPNDHYHAFADPMVVVIVGLGAAALWPIARNPAVGRALALVGVVALVGWNVTHQPPAVHPDGGWPAGEAAGDRVLAALDGAGVPADRVIELRSLPDFKSTEALAYPLVRRGRPIIAFDARGLAPGSIGAGAGGDVDADGSSGSTVESYSPARGGYALLCDDLFHEAIGAHCGGPAEDAAIAQGVAGPFEAEVGALLDRFEAHPGRWISVYAVAP